MDDKAMEALKGSIEKWQKIIDGTEIDRGSINCPLCLAFKSCDGCPVHEHTRRVSCRSTPYADFVRLEPQGSNGQGGYIHTDRSIEAAKAELKFLKSLLPDSALAQAQPDNE